MPLKKLSEATMGMFGARSKFSLKKEYLISEEEATKTVVHFCEMYDIDVDAQDQKTAENTEGLLSSLVEFVRRGLVEVRDDMKIVQHLQHAAGDVKEITYTKISGMQKRAMDHFGEREYYGKVYAILGSASGMTDTMISKLSGIDLKVAEVLGMLFLA